MIERVALIGFGEAGATFSAAAGWGSRACAFDILPSRATAMSQCGVIAAKTAGDALRGAQLVLSLVTADQALAAAMTYAPALSNGAFWCDLNSVAPETKRQAASFVEAAGARYVDVAVLSPVNPAKLKAPLLVSGASADAAAAALSEIGFSNVCVVGADVGRASAIKMIRSVMVKGVEALTDEMMAAAEIAGVSEEVLASLDASERSVPWRERAAYNLERMLTHGARRAAEMEEAVKTLTSLGVAPLMTNATVVRQRNAARPAPNPATSKEPA